MHYREMIHVLLDHFVLARGPCATTSLTIVHLNVEHVLLSCGSFATGTWSITTGLGAIYYRAIKQFSTELCAMCYRAGDHVLSVHGLFCHRLWRMYYRPIDHLLMGLGIFATEPRSICYLSWDHLLQGR